MILARDKYGRIGRKIPGMGFDAQIESPHQADHRGDVFLSPSRIDRDQQYHDEREKYVEAMKKAKAAQRLAKHKADALISKVKHEQLKKQEAIRAHDPEQEALKRYFGMQMGLSQESKVARSLITADFSASGGDPQIVQGGPAYQGVWAADFRKDKVVGNPLSRDGVFGIGTTDYDKIVSGVDIHQWNTVNTGQEKIVGGTMHGVYNDVDRPTLKAMGADDSGYFDWFPSTEEIGQFFSDVGSQLAEITDEAIDELRASLPTELKNLATSELRKLIASGDPRIPATISVPRYVPSQAGMVAGIPNWALYAGLGMMGVGVLLVLYKAIK